jgi:DNA-binding winged helix-turn-helix (wHTH) protein/tetratricopeptide (TPR) repeat protein
MGETSYEDPASRVLYRFGLFVLDVSALALTRNGIRVRLQDQPLQLLVLLLKRSGEIVTREELRQKLWPANTFVDFDKSLGVAVLKVREALGDNATNPTFLETIPRRGYRFIAPVSIETKTFGTVLSVQDLKHDSTPAPPLSLEPVVVSRAPTVGPEKPITKTRRWNAWAAVASCCTLVALGFAGIYFRSFLGGSTKPLSANSNTSPLKLRRSIAVLGFRNVGGDASHAWLSTAFTEMLNTELAANGDLRLISGEDVANAKRDLSLSVEGTLAKKTLAQLKADLGADVIVIGSYTLMSDGANNRIRLDLRAQDTGLGETIAETAITGDESDLFDIALQAGNRLRERLDPVVSLAPESGTQRFPGSTNQLAVQFYSEGRSRSYDFDFVGARDFFRRAVGADPGFVLAHTALSQALWKLGYESDARGESKLAMQHAKGLPPETQLAIQAQYQESIADYASAATTYRTLYNLFPDNLYYGLQLASEQLHLSPSDAEQTLTSLRKLPAPVGVDPRIDLMDASVMNYQDLPKARAAAERAIAKASALGVTLIVAHGYGILCQQDASIAQSMEQSVSECSRARDSYMAAGDQNNAARTLNDFAGLYFQRGELDQAEKMWKAAIDVFRTTGDEQGLAASSNNVGDVLLTRGNLTEAGKLLVQATAGYTAIGDRSGVGLADADLGQIALLQASLSDSQSKYEQAFRIGTLAGDKSVTAYGLAGLGDVLMVRDQLPAAREKYDAALKLRNEIGEKETILQSRVALARLDIEQGHAANAEREARACLSEFQKSRTLDDEIEAGLVLSAALLAQLKTDEAKTELADLRPIEEKSENRSLGLRFSLAQGRILLAEHDLRSSRALLETVSKAADSSGFLGIMQETQMLLADIRSESGDKGGAAKQLSLLEARDRAVGLLLLARETNVAEMNLAKAGDPVQAAR